jgi:hypothetical protein
MKHARKIFLASLLLVGTQFAWVGCVGPGDGGGVDYYGGSSVWVNDDVWVDGGGRGWYGGDRGGNAYVHPGGNRGGAAPRSSGGEKSGGGGRAGGGDKR